VALAAAAALGWGCGSPGGDVTIGDDRGGAAGQAGTAGAPTDPAGASGAPASGLTGSVRDRYRSAGNETALAPTPPRWASVEALPLGAAPATSYPGTISPVGDVVIPDVPAGPYLLALRSPVSTSAPDLPPALTLIELSARTFDLGRLFGHRPDVQPITRPTYLTIEAPLARPWQASDAASPPLTPNDSLFFYSRNAGVVGRVDQNFGSEAGPAPDAPAQGATALAWRLDAAKAFASYTPPGNERLIDGAKGDDFVAIHLASKRAGAAGAPPPSGGGDDPWAAYLYESAETALRAAPFTLTDGGEVTVGGTFTQPFTEVFDFDFKGAQFRDALRDAPAGDLRDASASLDVLHRPLAEGFAGNVFAPLLSLNVQSVKGYVDPTCNPDDADACLDPALCPQGCNDDQVGPTPPGDHAAQYTYRDPFLDEEGSANVAVVSYSFGYFIEHGLPLSVRPRLATASLSVTAPVGEFNGKALTPALGLPRNVTLNGQPADVGRVTAGVGASPAVAFDAPAFGTPSTYRVRVYESGTREDASGTAHVRRVVANVTLTGTAVKLPAGVLQAGKRYYLEITASTGGSAEIPFRAGPKEAGRVDTATTFSGVFTP
jgi:hypothetical protein